MRRTRSFRLWTALWLAMQLALPLGVSIADATFASQSADGRAHVEDATAMGCPPSHSADCGICKQLSTGSLVVAPTTSVDAASAGSAISAARPLPRQSARFAIGLARAPPVILA
jgi:hypothetical protein